MTRRIALSLVVAATLAACGDDDEQSSRANRPMLAVRAVDSPGCAPMSYGGEGRPDLLVAATGTLQGAFAEHGLQAAQAMKMVLAGRGWRAGDYTVALQVCEEADPKTGNPDLEKCRRHARAFARNRSVIALAGPYFSLCAREMLATLNRVRPGPLAALSGSNTYLGLTQDAPGVGDDEPERHHPRDPRGYARIPPADDAQGAAAAVHMQREGKRRVFGLHDDDAYGFGLSEGFRVAAERAGLEVVGAARWDPGARGYRALGARLRRKRVDGVFIGGLLTSNGPRLIRDLRIALGPEASIVASDSFFQAATIVEGAGRHAEDATVTIAVVPNDELPPRGRRFAAEFEQRFGQKPCCFSVHYAQAMQVLLDAIAGSDGTRADVARRLIAARVDDGLLGDFEFDERGDSTLTAVGVHRIEGGRFEFLGAISPSPELLLRN